MSIPAGKPKLANEPRSWRFDRPDMPSPTLSAAEETDRELVARAAEGKEQAIGVLYERHGRTLYALACRMVGDRADAEEVLMEAFAQAWRNASQFDIRRGSVGAWLTMMVRSRAVDLARARQRRERLTSTGAESDADQLAGISTPDKDPGMMAEEQERRRHVEAALRELPTAQREAITLAFFDGLTQSEIAERLNTPLGTIKTRIRDGMLKLRDRLRPLYVEHGI